MTSPMAPITRPTASGVVPVAVTSSGPVTAASMPRAVSSSRNRSASGVRTMTAEARRGGELGQRGAGDQPALVQDHDVVDGLGDLREQMTRHDDGAPGVGLAAQEGPQPVHALRVEAVGGLVEDEHRRLAEQGGGQAEALAHAEREPADTSTSVLGHADLGQRIVDPLRRQPGRRSEDAEVIDGPTAGMEAGRFQHRTDLAGGLIEVDVAATGERGGPRRRGDEAEQHAQRGRLAGTVGPEEAGDSSRPQLEGQVVDGGHRAETLGEAVQLDGGHGVCSFRSPGGDRRALRRR